MATVVVSHVAYSNGLSDWAWFAWHVPGFLIISGFFGIRFNWMKVIRLLGVCYGCYWLTIPFRAWPPSLISLLLPHGAWFLPFYLVLMIFSPILDAAMVDRTRHRKIFVACLILLVWGWVSTLTNNAHLGMLQVPGLNGNGLLLMMAIYLFGRLLHEHHGFSFCSNGLFDMGGFTFLRNWRRVCCAACYFYILLWFLPFQTASCLYA